MERLPRHDDTDVHEPKKVEKDIDASVDLIVALDSLLKILAVPVQGDAGHEAGQEIIGANGAACSDDKELKRVVNCWDYDNSLDGEL